MEAFQGPLPKPEHIEHYERVLPGAAARIIAQWEQQTAHRQGLERRYVDANVRSQTRGQYFAFALCVLILAIAVWLFRNGNDGWAFSSIVAELVAALLAFIYGRSRQQRERARKTETLAAPPSSAFE